MESGNETTLFLVLFPNQYGESGNETALFLVSFPNQYGESGNETTLFLGLTTYNTDKQLEEQGSQSPHIIGSFDWLQCTLCRM